MITYLPVMEEARGFFQKRPKENFDVLMRVSSEAGLMIKGRRLLGAVRERVLKIVIYG